MTRTTRTLLVLAALCIAIGLYFVVFPSNRLEPLTFKVVPFYDSRGPVIHAGKYSKDLAERDPERLLENVRHLKAEWDKLPIEVMYIAAVRLFDAGKRDEALYWFYTAHYRAMLFAALLDPKERTAENVILSLFNNAFYRFYYFAVPDLQAYAGCDQGKWLAVLDTVIAEHRTIPDLSSTYAALAFVPKTRWTQLNARVAAQERLLPNYIKSHWDQFRTARDPALEHRYCRTS